MRIIIQLSSALSFALSRWERDVFSVDPSAPSDAQISRISESLHTPSAWGSGPASLGTTHLLDGALKPETVTTLALPGDRFSGENI